MNNILNRQITHGKPSDLNFTSDWPVHLSSSSNCYVIPRTNESQKQIKVYVMAKMRHLRLITNLTQRSKISSIKTGAKPLPLLST